MKKLFILALLVMFGISLVPSLQADEARRIVHLFKGYTTSTSVSQSKTIYRITGVATGSNAVFGIYNVATLGAASDSNIAVESGEATSGDALPHMYFGEDGLVLDSGSTVVVSSCKIIIEYS